jgi:hypothetical protein
MPDKRVLPINDKVKLQRELNILISTEIDKEIKREYRKLMRLQKLNKKSKKKKRFTDEDFIVNLD